MLKVLLIYLFIFISVDAALAELDSIPDGGCEAGEVEDEEDEEEEWSYYKMEPQHQQVQVCSNLFTFAFY